MFFSHYAETGLKCAEIDYNYDGDNVDPFAVGSAEDCRKACIAKNKTNPPKKDECEAYVFGYKKG